MHPLLKSAFTLLALAAAPAAHAGACSGKMFFDGFSAVKLGGSYEYSVRVTNGSGSYITGDLIYLNFPADTKLKAKTGSVGPAKFNTSQVKFGTGPYLAPNAVKLELDRTTPATSGPTILLTNCR